MSLSQIVLTTNKSVSNVGDYVRKIGQEEKGQSLPVVITDANGSAYDLSNASLTFSENKEGGKIVSDNDSSHFSVTDAKAGKFTYTFVKASYAASGTAWFDIQNQAGTLIDTTRDFKITVINDPNNSFSISNDNYVSNLEAYETHFQGVINTAQQKSDSLFKQFQNTLDSTVQQAKTDFANQRSSLQTDYNSWKNQIISDFNTKLNNVNSQLGTDQTDLNNIHSSITTINNQISDFEKRLANVDFSKFATTQELTSQIQTVNITIGNLNNSLTALQNQVKALPKPVVEVKSVDEVKNYPDSVVVVDDGN